MRSRSCVRADRPAIALAGAALALAILPAAAGAEERKPQVSASFSGGLSVQDLGSANENVTVDLSADGARWVVTSAGGIDRGQGCDAPTTDAATGRPQISCPRVAHGQPVSNQVVVSLDSGNDVVRPGAGLTPAISIHAVGRRGSDRMSGGPGPDVLEGGRDNDELDGNEGDDEIAGDEENDRLIGDGGHDELGGGDGDDRLLDGDESAAGVRDDVLRGGRGNDTAQIGLGSDKADGGIGNDTILDDDGPAIADELVPDLGDDLLSYRNFPAASSGSGVVVTFSGTPSSPGDRLGFEGIEGTQKDDRLTVSGNATGPVTMIGLGGRDKLTGGNGPDTIVGGAQPDQLFGNGGNDLIDAKAGEDPSADPDDLIDLVDCGGGPEIDIDTALTGLTDPFGREHFDGCENVEHSAIGEGPHVVIASRLVLSQGRVEVRLRCPSKLRHRCHGTLAVAGSIAGLERASDTRYSLRAGRTGEVLAHPGAGVRRGRRAYVESIEPGDVKGSKTTRRLARVARSG